jgi:hypothetical protein
MDAKPGQRHIRGTAMPTLTESNIPTSDLTKLAWEQVDGLGRPVWILELKKNLLSTKSNHLIDATIVLKLMEAYEKQREDFENLRRLVVRWLHDTEATERDVDALLRLRFADVKAAMRKILFRAEETDAPAG